MALSRRQKDKEYKCKDCGRKMRRGAYTETCYLLKQCPQCYTKETMARLNRHQDEYAKEKGRVQIKFPD